MAEKLEVSDALKSVLPKFGIDKIKHEQKEILTAILDGKDCIATLPTGFGKSLAFQLYVPTKKLLRPDQNIGKVIVCCPLVALMRDQVEKIEKIDGINAAYKGSSREEDDKILNGSTDIIYASPESLVGDAQFRSSLQAIDVDVIVIDEFHTIATWGHGSDGTEKEAFRKWFSNIGELRSLFPKACVLALSATCTSKIRKRVSKVLSLKDTTAVINMSPNKDNIKIVVSKISNQIEPAMAWLIDGLTELKKDFPKTLIYCHTIRDVSRIYSYLIDELPQFSSQIQMFHSVTPDDKKANILDELKQVNSHLKLVICTTALGMGVDVVGVQSVIVYGIPSNAVDLIQEIGRAGRNGEPSVALLLFNSYHLRNTDQDLKDLYRGSECYRIALMKLFLKAEEVENLKKETGNHQCCEVCSKQCSCGNCTFLILERLFKEMDTTVSTVDIESEASEESIASTDVYYESDDEDLIDSKDSTD